MTIIKLNLDQMLGEIPPLEPVANTWIAGGAVRRWFMGGEELADVDFFGKSVEDFQTLRKERLSGYKETSKTPITTSLSNDRYKVQLMEGKLFPSVEATFDAFDFTLCQFAWTSEGIYTTDTAIISALRKHLVVHKISKEFAIDTLRRSYKYQSKGYMPCFGTLRDIANSLSQLTEEDVKKQVEMSPNGGSRFVRFD